MRRLAARRRSAVQVGARVGAQPQIGAKNIAILGALIENADNIAGDSSEQGLCAVLRELGQARWIIEKDQVDIARIIQLLAAQLAHPEDDEAGPVFRIL